MRRKTKKNGIQSRWNGAHEKIHGAIPHVYGVLDSEADYISLLIKAQPDGTCLAVLKQYGDDGTPMVCFGSGYGAVGCLVGLDSAVQGNRWKPDKPWEPKKK